jgi:hypothetical protein
MIETEAARDLKVTIRLVFEGKEIQVIERPFAVQSENETEQSKTLDDTVTEFAEILLKTANEIGYTISKDVVVQAAIALILYLVKQDAVEKTIEVQLTRPEVKENGNNADPS